MKPYFKDCPRVLEILNETSERILSIKAKISESKPDEYPFLSGDYSEHCVPDKNDNNFDILTLTYLRRLHNCFFRNHNPKNLKNLYE
mmetsp:Transcript_34068/g.52353  ORF Transcript_34068/g.52353 Transcript_34068/m.52353 type:complete len:87 (+) Transcript_34068:112-372(+)